MISFDQENRDAVIQQPTKPRRYALQVKMLKIDGEEREFKRKTICKSVLFSGKNK